MKCKSYSVSVLTVLSVILLLFYKPVYALDVLDQDLSHRVSEKSNIVIKLGGGLITDKAQLKTIRANYLRTACEVIAKILDDGHRVILVHGGGSFGHIEAKKWKLASGYDAEIIEGQRLAIKKVKKDMAELNRHVLSHLQDVGVQGVSHPASLWASGLGADFKGDLSRFQIRGKNIIQVTHGDLVDVDDERKFGVLSGDDLMVRLCSEIPDITHCLFLMGDTDGLLTKPIGQNDAELISVWSKDQRINGTHNESLDVTGGIFLKAESASKISRKVSNVWMLNGRKPERILELIRTGTTVGTKVI